MNLLLLMLVLLAAPSTNDPAGANPVFQELTQKGVALSAGAVVKLPPPILADHLDAAAQRAAIEEVADARNPVESIVRPSYYAPVVVKVRTPKAAEGEGPAVRTVDAWFVVHGDWDTLVSREFLESLFSPKEEGKSRIAVKSGVLTEEELTKRKLAAATEPGREERFAYSTFRLFERVEISATRFAVLARGKDSVVAAGRTDPRFDHDPEYPNQWRPLLRDEQGNIRLGQPHPLSPSGGYAKITRLAEPADAVFIEFHLVYEEPYGWFDGATLVKQKVPLMVSEKVKAFRRKLALASQQKAEKGK